MNTGPRWSVTGTLYAAQVETTSPPASADPNRYCATNDLPRKVALKRPARTLQTCGPIFLVS